MGKEKELLQRLIFLWGEASDLANVPAVANKRHKEYVKLRSIYHKEYMSAHPPTDDEFDRVIAIAARAESERKYMEGLAERQRKYDKTMAKRAMAQQRMDAFLEKVWSGGCIDQNSALYKKYARMLSRARKEREKEMSKEKIEELPTTTEPDKPKPPDWDGPRIGDIELY